MSPFAKIPLKFLIFIFLVALACNLPQEEKERIYREATETVQMQRQNATQSAKTVTAAAERGETPIPSETPAPPTDVPTLDISCRWVHIDTVDALATGGGTPGMTAEWEGNWIGTRYSHAGNFGCDEQIFVTAHEWSGLDDELIPGKDYYFSVVLTWRLEGEPECTSLTAGAKTSLSVGTTVVEIGQSTINLSSEPNGDLSNGGYWTAPKGNEGDTMTIKAHGSSGSLGGTVSINYEYICDSP
jgi:hypothetical protein